MIDPQEIALSKPALASAVLLVACTSGDKKNHRFDLIREIINAGMNDDEAVEFLALAVMPDAMLEETRRFIIRSDIHAGDLRNHRQNFFAFANDVFHAVAWGEACTIVSNAMVLSPVFHHIDSMGERIESLRAHGIDCSGELTPEQFIYGKGLLALMDSYPFLSVSESAGHLTNGSIEDTDLAVLIKESGDRYPELIDIIRERSTVDIELLRSMIDSPSPAVRSGTL